MATGRKMARRRQSPRLKSGGLEGRVKALEQAVKNLTEVLADFLCQDCGSLLVVHEAFADGQLIGYEAHCYDCGHIEAKEEPKEWHSHHAGGRRKRIERRRQRTQAASTTAPAAEPKP